MVTLTCRYARLFSVRSAPNSHVLSKWSKTEWHGDAGNWFRSCDNENWEFDENGLMRCRVASINDLAISESDRKFHWPQGRRPDDHPGLSDLGL